MGDGLLQTIRQVGIFVICAQMILHFKPSESYGKYIRLLVSVMVLVQLLIPIMDIFLKAESESFPDRITYYENILSEDMEDISVTCENAEQMLNSMTIEEIKTRINKEQEQQANTYNDSTNATGEDVSEGLSEELAEGLSEELLDEHVTEPSKVQEKEEEEDILIKKIEVLTDD